MFVTSSKLAAFTLAAVLLPSMAAAKSIDIEDLPSGCEKFTVGKCDPAKVSCFENNLVTFVWEYFFSALYLRILGEPTFKKA